MLAIESLKRSGSLPFNLGRKFNHASFIASLVRGCAWTDDRRGKFRSRFGQFVQRHFSHTDSPVIAFAMLPWVFVTSATNQ